MDDFETKRRQPPEVFFNAPVSAEDKPECVKYKNYDSQAPKLENGPYNRFMGQKVVLDEIYGFGYFDKRGKE